MKTFLFVVGIIFFFTLPAHANNSFRENAVSEKGQPKITYAVVVGISNYSDQEFPDLKYAHRDAEAFATFLQSNAGGPGTQSQHPFTDRCLCHRWPFARRTGLVGGKEKRGRPGHHLSGGIWRHAICTKREPQIFFPVRFAGHAIAGRVLFI